MLITSSVLILAILLLRLLFRSTVSRRVQYALWLLAALRLLIPLNLPAMEHNVLSAAEPVSQTISALAEHPVYRLPYAAVPVTDYAREELPDTQPGAVLIEGEGSFGVVDRAGETVVFYRQRIQPAQVLRTVRYVGMAAMALWFLAANLRFARKLRRTRVPLRGAESKYPVWLCDDIPSPCLFGLFRPAIYLTSAAAKDETRLRCVIAHEETHARHLDPLWSLVRSVCLAVWWFNPLVWLAAHCSKVDCELACDEGTLARLGEAERVPYGETLLALIPVRRGGDPMLAATTMTAGKRQMKERITRIAEHRRPLAIALAAALALTAVACAATFTGAEEQKPAEPVGTEQTQRNTTGTYASVDDYLAAVRAGMKTAVVSVRSGGERTANVLDTRVAFLEKDGELPGLAPDGTLELYSYGIETKTDVPPEEVVLAGGMGVAEDGWCDLEGQGGHSLVVLRYADGSVDVLFDRPNNDDRGGLYYYENTAGEMLYDWYVKENGLDLPRFTKDLALGGENRAPARRWDGEGWYVYIPVSGWYESSSGGTACWTSAYDTGSFIAVRESSVEEMTAERPQLAAGQAERFVEAPDGRIWLVWTRYDPMLLIRSDMTGLEPAVLEAMMESFAVSGAQTSVSPVFTVSFDTVAPDDFFPYIADEYWFLSGAGGWRSTLFLEKDGSFTGWHRDSDAGTVYTCDFSGRFGDVRKKDAHTYSVLLLELNCGQTEGEELGTRDGVRYVGALPYGMEGTAEFLVYLPDTPITSLPQEFLSWYHGGFYWAKPYGDTLGTVGLCNAEQRYGWFPARIIGTDDAARSAGQP